MELLSSSDQDLKRAAKAIGEGKLVAFPTETVYGLGADAFNVKALARVFEAKNRPRFDPLIIHIADKKSLFDLVDTAVMNVLSRERLDILTEELWPGPLTLVLPKKTEVPDLATAGLPSVAVRFPSHELAQKIIRLSSCKVAAPSANPFGYLSPTRTEHVISQLGDKVDYIVDGGRSTVGLESTVLDISGELPSILRPGGTTREAIETLIGPVELCAAAHLEVSHNVNQGDAPASPGMLKSHYAPACPLFLVGREELARLPDKGAEGRLYFSSPGGENKVPKKRYRVLSERGDLLEAAANLFEMLHELDGLGLAFIYAEKAPEGGLGEAINDRLYRAAASKAGGPLP